MQAHIGNIRALVDRIRPANPESTAEIDRNMLGEIARLIKHPEEATTLRLDMEALLALPFQTAFYAETGIRSALGFWLELGQRIGYRILPRPHDADSLSDIAQLIFHHPSDHVWLALVQEATWLELADTIGLPHIHQEATISNLLDAVRALSYRIAGTALDRELLRAEMSLERFESPFLAQNATLIPILERTRLGGPAPKPDEVQEVDVLLDQCSKVLARAHRKAGENGISIRLTYLLARLEQMIGRMRRLLDLMIAEKRTPQALPLLQSLVTAVQTRHRLPSFVGENISLIARNITDHASQHGEHYIAEDRAAWWAMARSAAGGGIVIALMAMLKIQLASMHLPPLTEGIAFGLNYGIGFVLIHLLGFSVATKQPAMTAAAIAATLEDARPKDLEHLGDLAQNVVRTQFIAVIGNVGLALPVACLLALLWPMLFGTAMVTHEKAMHMLNEVHPLHSGALFFAGVAGVGLFLSGLVSGYFDNQARYHDLAPRISAAPAVAWMGKSRARSLGSYLDTHYGAILGNLFFGMYLGLAGVLGILTGLPVDIRHVAFSSANLGTAMTVLDFQAIAGVLPWAIAGVICIALVNLFVSFTLALYVALKSRRLGMQDVARLTSLLLKRFIDRPLDFFRAPGHRD